MSTTTTTVVAAVTAATVAGTGHPHPTFTGMIHPDPTPLRTDTRDVKGVHMSHIPPGLREHAAYVLGDLSGSTWWTIGEFRYTESPDYEHAVARRIGARIQYGIETDGSEST